MKKAIRDYLEYQTTLGRTESTITATTDRLLLFDRHLHAMRVRAVRSVTIEHIRAYHDDLIRRKLKRSTINSYMRSIAGLFRWAHDEGRILTDIAKRIEAPKPDDALPPAPLTHDDMKKLLKIAGETRVWGRRSRAVIEIMYATGIRRSELIAIRYGDLNAARRSLFVRGKGQKDRIVPINEEALQAIADYLTSHGRKPKKRSPLFVQANGRALTLDTVENIFKSLRKRFHKHLHPHLIRHTFAVHLLKGGADIRYVQALLGHDSPDTTSRYLGLVKEDLKAEYDRAVEELTGG